MLNINFAFLRPCISANRHATENRHKRAKNGLCKSDCNFADLHKHKSSIKLKGTR